MDERPESYKQAEEQENHLDQAEWYLNDALQQVWRLQRELAREPGSPIWADDFYGAVENASEAVYWLERAKRVRNG